MAWHSTWNQPEPERRPLFMGRGTVAPGVTLILVVTVAAFVLDSLTHRLLTHHGGLSVNQLMQGHLWRLVTFQFLHSGLMHIGLNMLVLWMLGVALERQLGTRQFVFLYLLSGVAGGLLECGFNAAMYWHYGVPIVQTEHGFMPLYFLQQQTVGASAGVAGVLVAFAVLNPRAEFLLLFLLPIEARWLAIAYVGIETIPMVQGFFGHLDTVAHAAHLGGMAMGFAWIKCGGGLARWWAHHDRRPVASGFYGTPEREDEDEAELNRLLDKIRDQGTDSLTLREKLFLQEMSRRKNRRR